MSHTTARLLKERFRLERGEAEHILGAFTDAVENSLEEYGICHVAGVGTFVRAPGDRRTSFEPAESLARAVNVRFADLPVFEVDRGAAVEGAVTSPAAASAGNAARESSRPATGAPAIPSPPPDEQPAPDEPSAPPDEQPAPAEPSTPVEAAPVAGTPVPPDAAEAAAGPPGSTAENDDRPTVPPVTRSRGPRSSRRHSSGGRKAVWIALPLLAVVIAAVVWFTQRPDDGIEPMVQNSAPAEQQPPSGAENETDASTVETQTDETADAAGEAGPSDDTPTGQTEPESVAPDPAAAAQTAPQSASRDLPDYPLDRSVDGYTMIVGSSPDRAAADEQMSRFSELDLPYGVLDYSEEESSMYRLALGLYDSAQQADSARQAMSGVLPSGTWVWRIR